MLAMRKALCNTNGPQKINIEKVHLNNKMGLNIASRKNV